MFGYIRPLKGELKIREFEEFRALYCGLCRALGREYGLSGESILSYDFVYLAMLLWPKDEPVSFCRRRCIMHPFRARCTCAESETLSHCAAACVLLTRGKLQDGWQDEKGFKKLLSGLGSLALKKAAGKAAKRLPALQTEIEKDLAELSKLEKAGETSLDRAADPFARLTAALAGESEQDPAVQDLLYHTGRWIYLADGAEDLAEDCRFRRYNPIAARFAIGDGRLTDPVRAQVQTTMLSSLGRIRAAYELLEDNRFSPIFRNIIYYGMEETTRRVLDGTYRKATGRPGKQETE